MTKSELLQWLQEENQQWEALLAQIGPARMEQSGVNGEWSMKDVVAHLTGWNIALVAELQAAQRGEPEPPPPWPPSLQSDDEINAWIYQSNRRRSLPDILDDMRQTHAQLLATLEDLPDDVRIDVIEPAFHLVRIGDQRFQVDEFFHHFHDDHEPDVRAWLAQLETQ